MSIDLSQYPQFQQAPDLAGELCFYQTVALPPKKAKYNEMVANLAAKGERCPLSYEDFCGIRRNQPKMKMFAFYAMIHDNHLHPVIQDWFNPMLIEFDGVFSEMAKCANAAMKVKAGANVIVADVDAIAVGAKKFPKYFVHYNNITGRCTVLPHAKFDEAMNPGWAQQHGSRG